MLWIDFETSSQVDLKVEGAARYAQSLTTKVMCLGWAVDDDDVLVWWSDETIPTKLKDALNSDCPVYAHNADFERQIFDYVMENDFGLGVDIKRWRCSMVQALTNGLPAKLDELGNALDLPVKKQPHGTRLIREYCAPNHITEFKEDDRELMEEYCRDDVVVMRYAVQSMRELTDEEWAEYHLTCRINDRGIPVDVPFVTAALDYADDIAAEVGGKLTELTGGMMTKHTQRKGRDAWLHPRLTDEQMKLMEVWKNGKKKLSLDQEHRDILLSVSDLDDGARELLNLINDAGSAALKKYGAAANQHVNGRVHNTFQFHGAQTGRFSGRGIQPHNFRRDTWGGHIEDQTERDAYIEETIDTIKNGYEVDEPSTTMARLLRAMVHSKEGISYVDWSSIEGRVAPWLANSELGERKLDLYRAEKDVYVEAAAEMFSMKQDDVDKTLRQSGKICVARDTLVLTNQGLTPIQDVTTDMLLWDGVEWINHDGPVCNGVREVITHDNITATPDHEVWTWDGRKVQIQEAQREGWPLAVTEHGGKELPSPDSHRQTTDPQEGVSVRYGYVPKLHPRTGRLIGQPVSDEGGVQVSRSSTDTYMVGSPFERGETTLHKPERRGVSKLRGAWDNLRLSFGLGGWSMDQRELRFEEASRTGSHRQQQRVCEGQPALGDTINELREQAWRLAHAAYARVSGKISRRSLRRQHPTGLGSNNDRRTDSGAVEQTELQTQREVWDILNAGPRNRFTAGGRLISNCELSLQFGGGAGALQGMAKNYGVTFSDVEAERLVTLWRRSNQWAVQLWPKFERAAYNAVKNVGKPYTAELCTFQSDGNYLWCQLPSGRLLAYYAPIIELVETPWGEERVAATFQTTIKMKQEDIKKLNPDRPFYRNALRGALLMQNATQAVAADILRRSLVRADAEGLPVILSVHDEIGVEGGIDKGEKLNRIMLEVPNWAGGLPLATGGVEHSLRYGK